MPPSSETVQFDSDKLGGLRRKRNYMANFKGRQAPPFTAKTKTATAAYAPRPKKARSMASRLQAMTAKGAFGGGKGY